MQTVEVSAPGNKEMLTLGRGVPGVVRGSVRPTDRSRTDLAATVLSWMGKDPVRAQSRNPSGDDLVVWARSWLDAHQTHTVVVSDAQLLTCEMLTALTDVCSNAETLLLVRGPLAPEEGTWLGHSVVEHEWDSWKHRLAEPRSACTEPPSPDNTAPALTPADLPVCHFLMFRSRAQQVLGHTHAQRVDELYVTAFRAAQDAPTTVRGMVDHLEDVMVRLAASPADALVVLHATQAAMFAQGWLMRVDPDVMWRELSQVRIQATPDDWGRVAWEQDPEVCAILTLTLLHVPEKTILRFTIGQARRLVADNHGVRVKLPDAAVINLAARLHELGAEPADSPFIRRRQLRAVRMHARTHLGLRLDQPRSAERGRLTGTVGQLGIQLASIEGRR